MTKSKQLLTDILDLMGGGQLAQDKLKEYTLSLLKEYDRQTCILEDCPVCNEYFSKVINELFKPEDKK